MSSFISKIAVIGIAGVVVGSIVSSDFFIEIAQIEFNPTESLVEDLTKLNETRLNIVFITIGIIIGIGGLAGFYVSVLRTVRSISEATEQEIAARFSIEEKELRRQIEKEGDEQKKQALEVQALVLRQEYESLLSENLQRKDGGFVEDWREVLLVARKRLAAEQQRLRRRNLVNLGLGITGLATGVILLTYFLNSNSGLKEQYSFVDFLIAYWSRIGMVITVGVFAGFFLRLYALTERVIERNKNEMTNIELRLTSGLMLRDENDKTKIKFLAESLAKEERNFILAKNETSTTSETLDIERLKEIISLLVSVGTK